MMHQKFKSVVWCIDVTNEFSEELTIERGTGFSVSDNGLVMTCAHVVQCVNQPLTSVIKLHSLDNTRAGTATIVHLRTESDLALLKVSNIRGCDTVAFPSNVSLTVGQPVMTLGNPLNFVGSYLAGNISYGCMHIKKSDRKRRSTCATYDPEREPLRRYRVLGDVWNKRNINEHSKFNKLYNPSVPIIQTQGLNVTSGNSGGPLFNLNGEIVGMVHGVCAGNDISIHVIEMIDFMDEYIRGQRSQDRPLNYATQVCFVHFIE